jgi:dihydropteroate synthase
VSRLEQTRRTLRVGSRELGPGPVLLGILNVTPDSFSDGGESLDPEAAAAHAAQMLDEGAHVIDIGGESTRPYAAPVGPEEEERRVVPVIQRILTSRPEAVVSVDTYRASTARAALAAGARIVNDVTALRGDPEMASVVAEASCPVVLMHMQGEPKTMQEDPRYGNVVREVGEFLSGRADHAVSAGVAPENIVLDPGLGFGKTTEHNLQLLNRLAELSSLGYPLLVGASRKGFIGRVTGTESAGDRVAGTAATSVLAYERGARLFRVHDVRENREALEMAAAVGGV